jgi:hypothetical protein
VYAIWHVIVVNELGGSAYPTAFRTKRVAVSWFNREVLGRPWKCDISFNDGTSKEYWIDCNAFSLLSINVGKEMPISMIVVAVPNATVVLLD